ncbi:MAG: UbiX family flavin prenyltransferase [Deltaproteobacteria bacterium]|nr:MAG: UbiX family flavin prenyltransferase [Deltaproteobacteria bacterium]
MKIVLGISGSSGAIYATRTIHCLKEAGHSLELTASPNALQIGLDEMSTDYTSLDVPFFGQKDFSAPFASGSAVTAHYDAMVIIPCSMGTLGRIAHGYSDSLLTRAADVFLKEKKTLILVPRETPFNLVHIENMRLLALAGAEIIPAIPSFYSKPKTIEEAVDTVIARVLDHLGVGNDLRPRYGN